MKRIQNLQKNLLLFLLLASPMLMMAQVKPVSVMSTVNSFGNPYLQDYATSATANINLSLVLNDLSVPYHDVRLRIVISGASITMTTKDEFFPSPIRLYNNNPVTLTGADIVEYLNANAFNFSGAVSYQDFVTSGSKLPEGLYTFSFEVLDYARFNEAPLSLPSISTVFLDLQEPPMIVSPSEYVSNGETPFFNIQWQPLSAGNFPVLYTLEIFEKRVGLSYDQTVNTIQPIITRNFDGGTTIYQYGPQDPPLIPGNQYLVRIKAEDQSDQFIYRNNGYSEIQPFLFGAPCPTPINLSATASGPTAANLTWASLPTGANIGFTAYSVRYKKSNDANWTFFANSDVPNITVTGLSPGHLYEFQVATLCNDFGNMQSIISGYAQDYTFLLNQAVAQLEPDVIFSVPTVVTVDEECSLLAPGALDFDDLEFISQDFNVIGQPAKMEVTINNYFTAVQKNELLTTYGAEYWQDFVVEYDRTTWGDGAVYPDQNDLFLATSNSYEHLYNSVSTYNICVRYKVSEMNMGVFTGEFCYVEICGDAELAPAPTNEDEVSPCENVEFNFYAATDTANLSVGFDYNLVFVDTLLQLDSLKISYGDETDSLLTDTSGSNIMYTYSENGIYSLCMTGYFTNLEDTTAVECTKCEELKYLIGCESASCAYSCVGGMYAGTLAQDSSIILCGGLKMILTQAPSGDPSSLSGKGKVYIPWLKTDVAVEFSNISVNASQQLCSGEIYAEHYDGNNPPDAFPIQWGINATAGIPWVQDKVDSLNNWVNNTVDQAFDLVGVDSPDIDLNEQVDAQVQPVKVPLGIVGLEGNSVALSEFRFTPNGNDFAGIAVFQLNDEGAILGFSVNSLPFNRQSPSLAAGAFELVGDQTISLNSHDPTDIDHSLNLIVNDSDGPNGGTKLTWNSCNKLMCIDIDASFGFPRDWLIPYPDNGMQSEATFFTEICNWSEWLTELSMEESEIVNSSGMRLQVENIVYDHSDFINSYAMAFPENYVGDQTELFQGFYIKTAKLVFPDTWTTYGDPSNPGAPDPGMNVETVFNDIIINNTGFTGKLFANNVLNLPYANISDLGASIDTIKVEILQSTFVEAYVKGRVILPVSEESPGNALLYTGLFGTGNYGTIDGFQFVLEPEDTIRAELFADGALFFHPSSNFTASFLDGGQKTFDLALSGSIDFPDQTINNPINGEPIYGVEMELSFQDVGLNYDNMANPKMTSDSGTWSFASPQKKFAGFNVTVENIKIEDKSPQGSELLRQSLNLDLVVNLSENIGGRTTIGLVGSINKNPDEPLSPKFEEFNIEKISVKADLAAVKIEGDIYFVNNDVTYGSGFSGQVSANFKATNLTVAAAAQFGKTDYNNSGVDYRYWRVEAKVILPQPVPLFPGVGMYGAAVGAWRHMSADFTTANVSVAENPGTSLNSGVVFTPDANINFGFQATAVIANMGNPAGFNSDLTFYGQFSQSNGISLIGADLDFWVGAGFQERNDAVVNGTAGASYDFVDKFFQFNASVNFNESKTTPITTPTPVSCLLEVDGLNNLWHFDLGTPQAPNTIKVFNITTQSYMMFGNDITPPTNYLPATLSGYYGVAGSYPTFPNSSQMVNTNTTKGKGFAFGAGVNFSTGAEQKHVISRLYISWAVAGGFELNASMLQYDPNTICAGYNPTGIGKNWRVGASAAFWANANIDYYVSCSSKWSCIFTCCNNWPNGRTGNIIDLGIAAFISAEFARPSYMTGALHVNYSVLGFFSGSFNTDFEWGEECNISSTSPGTVVLPAEDVVEDLDNNLISSTTPGVYGNYFGKLNEKFEAKFEFLPNYEFSIPEVQTDGSINNRVFKLTYTTTLKRNDSGVWKTMNLTEEFNTALQSYSYYTNGYLTTEPVGPFATDVNNLEVNKAYRLIINATLQEYIEGTGWIQAEDNNGNDITQLKTVNISTSNGVINTFPLGVSLD